MALDIARFQPLPIGERLALLKMRTSEKKVALAAILDNLPANRRRFLDIGSGGGELTLPVAEHFRHTVAFERQLKWAAIYESRPRVELVSQAFSVSRRPRMLGDKYNLILLSHVLYMFSKDDWPQLVKNLYHRWLAPGGVIQLLLQSGDTDSSELFNHFDVQTGRFYHHEGLMFLAEELSFLLPGTAQITASILPSDAVAMTETEMMEIALFYLADIDGACRGCYQDIYDYAIQRFRQPDGSFRIRSDQDLLIITKPESRLARLSRL